MLKKFQVVFILLLIFGFSSTLVGKEKADTYFPHAIGSYWVYEDQDGNELTRRVIKNKEIAGETYRAFSYEPVLENWIDYDYRLHPNLYQIDAKRVTFLAGDDVEKAIKARLAKEVETFSKIHEANFDLLYEIVVEAQDPFYVLPNSVAVNEKWDAAKIKAKVTMRPDPPQDPEEMILEFTIVETGKVLGTENVETPTGTFEDCLKIEYRTATEVAIFPQDEDDESNPPGESVTTLWVAPNVGIVKFHQKAEDILLTVIPLPQVEASTTVKTFELKEYEVKPTGSGSK